MPTPAEIAATVVLALDPARFSDKEIGLAIADAIAQQHPALKATMLTAQKYLKPMTPINEFLILKEMTASDLLELSGAEESTFWGEYAAWKESALESLRERLKEIADVD